jgi:hypothetical protein
MITKPMLFAIAVVVIIFLLVRIYTSRK